MITDLGCRCDARRHLKSIAFHQYKKAKGPSSMATDIRTIKALNHESREGFKTRKMPMRLPPTIQRFLDDDKAYRD